MKTRNVFYVIIMLCVLGGFAWAENNSSDWQGGMGGGGGGWVMPGEEFHGIGARCLLKISCDPSILRLDDRMMQLLWNSTGVLNKAYRETLEDCNSPMGWDAWGDFSFVNGILGEAVYSVGVAQTGKGKEKEILAAAVENLKTALSRIENEELQKFRDRFSQTDIRCMEAETQVAEMQKQVRAMTIHGVTDRNELQKKISGLNEGVLDMRLRKKYCDNRIQQLGAQKDKLRNEMEKAVAADAVVMMLQQIYDDTRQLVLQSEEGFKSGNNIPAEKVQEAKEKQVKAKIDLTARIEAVRDQAGQKQLIDIDSEINDQVSHLSEFAIAEEFRERDIAETVRRLEESDKLELLEMKLNAAKKSFQDILASREFQKNRFNSTPRLSVSVIGLE